MAYQNERTLKEEKMKLIEELEAERKAKKRVWDLKSGLDNQFR